MRLMACKYAALIPAMCWAILAVGNNLQVTNTAVVPFQPNAGLVHMRFDIAWENSWRYTNVNHDAAWVFFKVRKEGDVSNIWTHIKLEGTGINPPGYSTGTGTGIEMIVPDDGVGVFIRRAAEGSGSVSVTNVLVAWNFYTNGMTRATKVQVQTLAIEMVYVAQGSFYVGDGTTNMIQGHFEDGVSGMPLAITNEGYAIKLGGGTAGSLGNNNTAGMLGAGLDDFNDTTSTNLPAAFPKGYAAFYCMKYEITAMQYVEFLNLLTRVQQNACTVSQAANIYALTGSANVFRGNIVRCPGIIPAVPANIVFGCDANTNQIFNETVDFMDRGCCDISWAWGMAYSDWSGLRPMTELEFEKACRGTNVPVANECAWGITNVTTQNGYDVTAGPIGSGRETALPATANCNTGRTMGSDYGPVRAGIYARTNSTRELAGASFWGLMDMSGSLYERVVPVGTAAGRLFTGLHGDGSLTAAGGANVAGWPASGCGRGGEWYLSAYYTRVSDRYFGAYALPWIGVGYRGIRTAPAGVGP